MKPRILLAGVFASLLLATVRSALGADPMTYKEIAMLLRNKEQEQFILNDTARRKLLQPLSSQEEQALSSIGASPALITALRAPELVMSSQSAASYKDDLQQRKDAALRQQQLQEAQTRQLMAQQAAAARAFPSQQPQANPVPAPAGNKPLELKFTAVDGAEVDLSKLRGKVVLVQFWATWCGPCMQEVPHVVDAYQKYHAKGFEIVGISLDKSKAAMQKVSLEKGMTWPQYFDGRGWENQISSAFKVQAIPALWLLNKQGVVVTTNARGNLERAVEKLLAE